MDEEEHEKRQEKKAYKNEYMQVPISLALKLS